MSRYRLHRWMLNVGLVLLLLVIRSAYALAWLLALLAVGLIRLRDWLGQVAGTVLDQLGGEIPRDDPEDNDPSAAAPMVVDAVVIDDGRNVGSTTR